MNALDHSLAGQAATITGGTRGIGMAIALAFAQAGANVAVCDIAIEDGQLMSVAEEIQTPVLEIDPIAPVYGDEMEAHEEGVPIPLLFVNAAWNDVIVRKGAVSPANHAAPQGADPLSGFSRQFV